MLYNKIHLSSLFIVNKKSLPFAKQIVDSIQANSSCTQVVLYMTWGYKNGFISGIDTLNYEDMSARVQRGYEYLSELYNLSIVPIGQVWKSCFLSYLLDT